MNIDELKNEVSHLIARNQIQKALNLISENDAVFEDSKANDIVMKMSTFQALSTDINRGTISHDNATRKRNQIVSSILSICGIENNQKKVVLETTNLPNTKKPLTYKQIKAALKAIKDKKGNINYHDALDVIGDLF